MPVHSMSLEKPSLMLSIHKNGQQWKVNKFYQSYFKYTKVSFTIIIMKSFDLQIQRRVQAANLYVTGKTWNQWILDLTRQNWNPQRLPSELVSTNKY